MRIALLVILAGISYALAVWALLRAGQHRVPGATLKDVAASPGRNREENDRLVSLHTPRGVQLLRVGMVLVMVCTTAILVALIDVVFRLPSIMDANTLTITDTLVREGSSHRPSILLIWVAELLLAAMGFATTRDRPLLAIPFVALAIIWFFDLTAGFRGPHGTPIGTRTERLDTIQIGLATAIVLFATAQGMRSWMVRRNKRAEETPSGV